MCTTQTILCVLFLCMVANSSDCVNSTPGTLCVISGGSHSNPTCRAGDPCEINCGSSQCKDKELNGQLATDLTITCSGSDACKGNTDIICGTGDCILQCNQMDTSCEATNIINPNERAHSFQCFNFCNKLEGNIIEYTQSPTRFPTLSPSVHPTQNPSIPPTNMPSKSPTLNPTLNPTINPSKYPTKKPTINPTKYPTISPTINPTTANPTQSTISPTSIPTESPTTALPTLTPTQLPSQNPSSFPTNSPSVQPSTNPSFSPTLYPTRNPTKNPIIDGIRADEPTIAPVIGSESDQTSVKMAMDGTNVWIIIAISLVSICIFCGIIILCVKKRKRIKKANFESEVYRNQIEIGVNNTHINGQQTIEDGTSEEGINDGNKKWDNQSLKTDQTQYLSEAQREAVHVTVGNDSAEILYNEEENESDPTQYLSKAQQNQLAVTAGGPEYEIRYDNEELEYPNECNDELQASVNENNYLSKAQENELEMTAGKDRSELNENKNKNVYLSEAQKEHISVTLGAPNNNYIGLDQNIVTIGEDIDSPKGYENDEMIDNDYAYKEELNETIQ